ncbi:hypothetical protein DL762_002687 [Monosporascus cannonballus]|uniref:Phytanoyl-CoA dioxygenase n=1 Tax=Monosporascus cannonballus TaxID=155416 RepID=A0ABY0HCM0_9PEZI|nr:hypothetical protein DL762_002687 [Monosporascus cannonballus]
MPPSTPRNHLDADGFVVIRNILTPEQVSSLRAAAERTTALARSGGWPHVRTVGKQFPPWDAAEAAEKGIWGVQGLNDPALPAHAAFLRVYFGDEVLGPAAELMACSADDDLVMELHNLLVRPDRGDFELRWHRDDIPAEATPEEEAARLDELHRDGYWHAQWNLALCDGDESLVVVPGSHRRARTAAERAAGPLEPGMPGRLVVRLGAGDAVFYDNNILHRGVYDAGRERLTLHGSVGRAGPGAGRLRARNVLQHGVGAYVDRCDFSVLDERYRPRAEAMRARLVQLGRESGDVGYSLTG